ncbi:hypothetical protein [Zymomonas mobilis]|uniref:Uncharacterized protein n=1 Tax=Zymomonas mobilis subsp. pomaceae (strain ATCC 29192 / DSM 22645 / JCM 10191 / CCUG 17912 / NBRC 13757 / NCIMB 11200 / NRRL B-4491 / Barker I) TaxID=579138 RepID=F8EW09_ZYMMT|nr:hypothetical protein [Zymomonas mobilis]AEI38419.1 hypothetical protein Zymop_1529 [Zymomonas mobilis subsp. pomaceae ATCC 29192]MDX5948107.1 hypothetical protein [Zymomonas mobilis subsp. pomaceae]GEB89780.1 hypothetical protein ZMO02_14170 [Zymomonas mobilis subsp. pomaceae]
MSVGVHRVNEIDAEFGQAPQCTDDLVVIGRQPPYALDGDTHRVETKPVDTEIAINHEMCRI